MVTAVAAVASFVGGLSAAQVAAGAVTLGAAAIGSRATSKAVEAVTEGQQQALEATTQATDLARVDVSKLFGGASTARGEGFRKSLDFLSGAPAAQIQPFRAGNIQAQEQVARGLPQIQNAILGLPTDLSEFKARNIGAPSNFNFDLSRFAKPPAVNTPRPLQPLQRNRQPLAGNRQPSFLSGNRGRF